MSIILASYAEPKLTNLLQSILLNGASVALITSAMMLTGTGAALSLLMGSLLGAILTLGLLTIAVLVQEKRSNSRAATRSVTAQQRHEMMLAAWDEDMMDERVAAADARAASETDVA